jgi:hypothetical protein
VPDFTHLCCPCASGNDDRVESNCGAPKLDVNNDRTRTGGPHDSFDRQEAEFGYAQFQLSCLIGDNPEGSICTRCVA